MIHVKDHKQYNIFNPFDYLGPKRLALLESSWAHLFREEILHNLPVEKLFPLYSKQFGRRTKELYAMLGITLLQQQQDLTDDEAIRQFAFNIEWQYALNVTDPSDLSSYVSPRTLWTMRDITGTCRYGKNQSTALESLRVHSPWLAASLSFQRKPESRIHDGLRVKHGMTKRLTDDTS